MNITNLIEFKKSYKKFLANFVYLYYQKSYDVWKNTITGA